MQGQDRIYSIDIHRARFERNVPFVHLIAEMEHLAVAVLKVRDAKYNLPHFYSKCFPFSDHLGLYVDFAK